MFDQFQIIAHRGWPAKYPENTILSFDKAIEAGATMIEFDVQITQDDRLIIFHDETAKRLCDRNLKIGLVDSPSIDSLTVQDQPVPYLSDVLDKYHTDINYYVELKTFKTTPPDKKIKLAHYTVNEIFKRGLQKNCLVVVWEEQMLNVCRKLGHTNVGLNFTTIDKPCRSKVSCRDHTTIKSEVNELTFAWTVNNAKRMKTLIDKKVNGIVTDHVDKLVNICNTSTVNA